MYGMFGFDPVDRCCPNCGLKKGYKKTEACPSCNYLAPETKLSEDGAYMIFCHTCGCNFLSQDKNKCPKSNEDNIHTVSKAKT